LRDHEYKDLLLRLSEASSHWAKADNVEETFRG